MPPKKKVKKPVKQKQKQSQSQKVIINLQDVKKTKSTRRRKPVKKQTEQNIIPRGWNVYSTPDRREIDEIRGQLINVQNKLISAKPLKNEVGRPIKYYSREDNIGDFSNKMKFVDNEKKEQKKQQQNILKDIRKKGEIKKQEQEQFGMFQEDRDADFVNVKKVNRPRKYIKKERIEEEEPEFSTISESSFV